MSGPMVDGVVLALGMAIALAGWWYLFRLPPEGLWNRTWVVGASLGTYAIVALALGDRLTTAPGPVTAASIGTGLGVGGAWLVATHVGHVVLCRILPGFLEQVTDLYSLREGDRVRDMVGPVVVLATAEELFFRGVVQGHLGVIGSIAVYTAVQLVAGRWALTLAAALGGAVWGLLAWWTGGLVAPVLAHVLWTSALAFVWPLRGCGPRPGAADTAPLADDPADDVPGVTDQRPR
jgi:uncharacterized protein